MHALAPPNPLDESVFRDGLGVRRPGTGTAHGEAIEILEIAGQLSAGSAFEFALRERVNRLSSFRHPYFAQVRTVQRLTDWSPTLTLVSDHVPGVRLSDVLSNCQEGHLPIDTQTAICFIRQLVPAVAALHEFSDEIAHGAIAPERLILTPHARIVVVEHVLGSALEQMRLSHERYWKDLQIALPRSAGAPRFDARADVMQVGMVALSLLLGRAIQDDEYPARLGELVGSVFAVSSDSDSEPLPSGMRAWFVRALQLESRNAFSSAIEARIELDRILDDSGYIASPASLEAFAANYFAAASNPLSSRAERHAEAVEPVSVAPTVIAFRVASQLEQEESLIKGNRADDGMTGGSVLASVAPPASAEPSRRVTVMAAVCALVVLSSGVWLAARRYLPASAPTTNNGTLVVTTNPAGAEMLVDGQVRGQTPVTLPLAPGQHLVELRANGESRSIPIVMRPGLEVSQYVDLPAPVVDVQPPPAPVPAPTIPEASSTPMPGWITVSAPIDLQLFENTRLFGTSAIDRIMLTAGRHEVELVNDELGYRSTRVVQVVPGKALAIKVDLPNGSMALNAVPWAEASVDGVQVGQTPLGNVPAKIGTHTVVFRHPDLGERQQIVTVTLKGAARLSVDMRKP